MGEVSLRGDIPSGCKHPIMIFLKGIGVGLIFHWDCVYRGRGIFHMFDMWGVFL